MVMHVILEEVSEQEFHNTLEAAVYGKPLAFGPRIQKFRKPAYSQN